MPNGLINEEHSMNSFAEITSAAAVPLGLSIPIVWMNCADNAAAESFFDSLKRERVNRKRYQIRTEARNDAFDYSRTVAQASGTQVRARNRHAPLKSAEVSSIQLLTESDSMRDRSGTDAATNPEIF